MDATRPREGESGPVRRSLAGAAIQTYATSVFGAVLSLANVLVMARAIGPSGRGDIAFLTAMAYLASNLATFGVQESIGNIAGTEPGKRPALASNAVLFSLVFGALANLVLVALFIIVPASTGDLSLLLLALTLLTIPVLILQVFLRLLVQADYCFGVANVSAFLPIVVNLVGNAAFASVGALTVTTAACTWIVGQFLATLVLVWHVSARLAGFGRPDAALARRSLVFGVKSHIGRVMLLGNYRLDVWVLGAYATSTEVGLYSVAVAWAEALFFLPTALAAVQRPDLVRLRTEDAGREAARLFRTGLIVTAALTAGLVVFAPVLCVGVFGEEFRGSIAPLRVLALGGFGIVALKQLSGALTAKGFPVLASAGVAVGFVATIVFDFALIPSHGGVGAAWASTLAYTLGGIAGALVFTRVLSSRTRELAPRLADVKEFARMLRIVVRRSSPSTS